VVSLARLRQEFYGQAPNRRLLTHRLLKEAIHEIGHTLGLVHCLDRTCPMSLATNIRQLDTKSLDWCANCAERVRRATEK
jgi:archaemetzincin